MDVANTAHLDVADDAGVCLAGLDVADTTNLDLADAAGIYVASTAAMDVAGAATI